MALSTLDLVIIFSFVLITLGIIWYARSKASKGIEGFFLGGKNLPWYLVGLSMVATTFGADTPLAVAEIVSDHGISGNWVWWNMLFGGMFTAIFFAQLWKRSGVVTETEFITLRYSGKQALWLKKFKAVYLGVIINAFVLAWVNIALISILKVFFGITGDILYVYTAVAMLLVAGYSAISGLLGVILTDAFQFFIAIIGCIILAIVIVNSEKIGGVDGLVSALPAERFNILPEVGNDSGGSTLAMGLASFLAFAAVVWWSSWYPGAEPGGGGYIAQRMFSAKNEKHSFMATFFFQLAHYGIRPWPWILVGLCALAIYPLNKNINDPILLSQIETLKSNSGISDKALTLSDSDLKIYVSNNPEALAYESEIRQTRDQLQALSLNDTELAHSLLYSNYSGNGFVLAIKDFLPSGLRGLLLVAFLAAYMSTISTQLNWGASYVVNDLWNWKGKSDKEIIRTSRWVTFGIMLIGLGVTTQVESIKSIWEFIMQCGAGLGLVLMLRWFWFRINAWTEIAATITPFIVFGILKFGLSEHYPVLSKSISENPTSFFITVGVTTIVWILVAYLTKADDQKHLESFKKKIYPMGFEIYKKRLSSLFISWIGGLMIVYSFLFLVGKIIFKDWDAAGILLVTFLVGCSIFYYFAKRAKLFS